MAKMNIVDNQSAFEYVLYMMLGSYFKKAVCSNKLFERKLHMQYLQQKEKQQVLMEEICIRLVENELMPQLPEEFWEQKMKVRFVPTSVTGMREIQFIGAEYALRVSGVFRGKKNTSMHYEAWSKGSCLAAT